MALPHPTSKPSTSLTLSIPQKSSCLLCSNPVIVPTNEDPNSRAAKERIEMVKTLCFHLQMDPKEIPNACIAEMFPFCNVCQHTVKQLWEHEKVIQDSQEKITRCLTVIERTVADAELLKISGPSSAAGGGGGVKPFVKLREKILAGYKTKLMVRQKLRETLILGGQNLKIKHPTCSHTVVQHDKAISSHFRFRQQGITAAPQPSTSSACLQTTDESVEASTNQTNADGDGLTDGQRARGASHENEIESGRAPNITINLQRPPQQQQKRAVASTSTGSRSRGRLSNAASTNPSAAKPSIVGQYVDSSCSMVISSVHVGSESEPGTSAAAHAADVPPVFIKQEPSEYAPVPAVQGKRRRRTLFHGIEIRRVTDPQSLKLCLQCSICRFVIPVAPTVPQGQSTFQKMQQHIADKHLGKKKKRAALSLQAKAPGRSPRRQFTCKICSTVFENMKSLFDHKSTHHQDHTQSSSSVPVAPVQNAAVVRARKQPSLSTQYYVDGLKCDICHRPIKGTLNNLLAHKFSHKNNEERKAAIAAGEPGTRQSLLNTNTRTPTTHSKKRPMGRYNVTKKSRKARKTKVHVGAHSRKVGRPPAKVIANEDDDDESRTLDCKVCDRKFSRACHLVLHMQGHARRSQIPAAAPVQNKGREAGSASDAQQKQRPDESMEVQVDGNIDEAEFQNQDENHGESTNQVNHTDENPADEMAYVDAGANADQNQFEEMEQGTDEVAA